MIYSMEQVREARKVSGKSKKDAAPMVGVSWRTWENWETGRNPIIPSAFQMFLLMTGQFSVNTVKPATQNKSGLLRVTLSTADVIDIQLTQKVSGRIVKFLGS